MKRQNKIIAIDNNPDHLKKITSIFHENGIGCLPILYDQFSPPESPFKNVRIAFFDINLRDTTNQSEIINDLANAINEYIDEKNGPYALIFWTQNGSMVEDIISYINIRRPETPRPYLVTYIDKDQFCNPGSDSLDDTLSRLLTSPTLDLLLRFEEDATTAASSTINKIYSLIPSGDSWGTTEQFNTNFDIVFSNIAYSTLGKHAKDHPDRAIYEALSPIVMHLLNRPKGDGWNSFLTRIGERINYPDGFSITKLNSIFHIDTNNEVLNNKRGSVFEYLYKPRISKKLLSNGEYYNSYECKCKELFDKFISFDKEKIDADKIFDIYEKSRFVVIEISASCDYAQDKKRNLKYILGVLSPLFEDSFIKEDQMSDSILYKNLPAIHFQENDFRLFVNLNFSFSDFEVNENFGDSLFIFKKEIVDMIGNRYANHVSRIGITSF